MNFDLTDEQNLLRESALRLGQDQFDLTAWRARAEAGKSFDPDRWARMAALGWLAVGISEDDGGLGGTPVETMVLTEAVGRFLWLEPFVSTCVIAAKLLEHAAPDRRADLLGKIAEGRAIVALADAEAEGGYDPAKIETTAVAQGDRFVLSGRKSHALDGGQADGFIIPARIEGEGTAEISLFFVPADAPGLTVEPLRAMDHRLNARLDLDGVEAPADALIGAPGAGLALLRDALDRGRVARLAEALGAMEAVHAMTLAHLKTRHQFGKPLAAFQALQHRAVDMAIACEEARSMTWLATLSLDRPAQDRDRIIAAAKARVSQTSLYVARQAVQLHGGVGFSEELAVGHYLKRLIMIDMAFGNAAHHRSRLATLPPSLD